MPKLILLITLLSIQSLVGCSDSDTSEQQIRQLIDDAEAAVENKSLMDAKGLISEQYRDARKRTRRDLIRLLAGVFLRNESIYLRVQINDIALDGADRADAVVYAAMAGRPLDETMGLLSLRADLYRFDLEFLMEDGVWQIIGGRWRQAKTSDFVE
ncbi:MAG: hypothetical protein GY703_06435 [Gammaproteobacteria bacterium]|nr:hypothetical protein [Gammaproteobacteria bacterium]